jgi:hypothetical protein
VLWQLPAPQARKMMVLVKYVLELMILVHKVLKMMEKESVFTPLHLVLSISMMMVLKLVAFLLTELVLIIISMIIQEKNVF